MNTNTNTADTLAGGQALAIRQSIGALEHSGDVEQWWQFLEDVLDVRRVYSSAGELHAVSLLVTYGGPTTWVDVDAYGATVRTTWDTYATEWTPAESFGAFVLEAFDTWAITR